MFWYPQAPLMEFQACRRCFSWLENDFIFEMSVLVNIPQYSVFLLILENIKSMQNTISFRKVFDFSLSSHIDIIGD